MVLFDKITMTTSTTPWSYDGKNDTDKYKNSLTATNDDCCPATTGVGANKKAMLSKKNNNSSSSLLSAATATACSSSTSDSISTRSPLLCATAQSTKSFEFGIPEFVTPPPKPKRPLHEEKTLQSITEQLNQLTLQDQMKMMGVVKWAKEGTEDGHIYNELNQLSMSERELVMYDIHGVARDAEGIESKSVELEEALEAMANEIDAYVVEQDDESLTGSCAYSIAESQSSEYVQNRRRRLLFLMAEQKMNPQLAAKRYVDFFDQKLTLFGPSKLCKDIALADLSGQDMEFLSQGAFQLLPTRDRAGRAVFVHMPVFMKPPQVDENMVSCFKVSASLFLGMD